MCENEVFSTNVSWMRVETDLDIQNSTEVSIYTSVLNNMTSVSRLIIHNITQGYTGGLPSSNWGKERNERLRKNQTMVVCVDSLFLFQKKLKFSQLKINPMENEPSKFSLGRQIWFSTFTKAYELEPKTKSRFPFFSSTFFKNVRRALLR